MRFGTTLALALAVVSSTLGLSIEKRQNMQCILHTHRKQERWASPRILHINPSNNYAVSLNQYRSDTQNIDGHWFLGQIMTTNGPHKSFVVGPDTKHNDKVPSGYKFKFDITMKDGRTVAYWLESGATCGNDDAWWTEDTIQQVTWSYKTG